MISAALFAEEKEDKETLREDIDILAMLRRLFSSHPQLSATLRPITKTGSRKSRQLRKGSTFVQ